MEQEAKMETYVSNQPTFLEDAFKDVVSMEKFAGLIAEGGNLQDHFYMKHEGGAPDYTSPNIGMILLVISWGMKLDIPFTVALQQIIPIDQKMCIRGDLAKALIMDRVKDYSWIEEAEGSVEDGSFKYIIRASRGDLDLTRSFSIWDAKQKGLIPSDSKLNGPHKAQWLQSPWHNYKERMCMYRALGFMARDMFPDVMQGLILQEEVWDYPDMNKVIVDTEGGDVELNNKSGKEQRTESLTQHAVEKIDKNGSSDLLQEKTNVNEEGKKVETTAPEAKKPFPIKYRHTEAELMDMKDKVIRVAEILGIMDEIKGQEGKNTNKKVRQAILTFYSMHPEEGKEPTPEERKNMEDIRDTPGEIPEDLKPQPMTTGEATEAGFTPPDENIPVVGEPDGYESKNAWELMIPDLEDDGERDFPEMSVIFREMGNRGITDEKYMEVAAKIHVSAGAAEDVFLLFRYPDKEQFCSKATIVEINYFIDQFDGLS